MLYPVAIQTPKDTLVSLMYKHDIHFNHSSVCKNNLIYIYSYKAYDDNGDIDVLSNEIDEKTGMTTLNFCDFRKTDIIIVIDVDHDNIDYAKFIISDVTLRLLLNSLINGIKTNIHCYVIGHRFSHEWTLFCREYYWFKERLMNMRTTNHEELWDKYFMYNQYSRTKEYLDAVKNIDKKLASYLLPNHINTLPYLSILRARNPLCHDLYERDILYDRKTSIDMYWSDKEVVDEMNKDIISSYDDI